MTDNPVSPVYPCLNSDTATHTAGMSISATSETLSPHSGHIIRAMRFWFLLSCELQFSKARVRYQPQ